MALRYRLDNGLTVLFQPQHAADVAAFQVWVQAGSADERPDQAGLAHLHEHMLFKGTKRRGPGEIARDIEGHGGEVNAWTSFDQTVYHVVLASAFAEKGLDVLGDAVRHSAFDEGELAREIEVVCEEIKRGEDSPARRASRDLFATAFRVHPYQRPVIGWAETVRGFTRARVLEFYERHYAPQNMVLVAVGALEEAPLREWVEAHFGGDWGRPYPGRVTRAAEPPAGERRLLLRRDPAKEAYVNLGFPIPAVAHEDVPALDVLAMIAGQGDTSRLGLEVKRSRALVNAISAYAYTPRDPGLFGVGMTTRAEQAKEAFSATVGVLEQLRRSPPPEDELATVQALLEARAIYQRETVQGICRKLGFFETTAGGLEAEARYYERVAQLTPPDVLAVAQRYLRLETAAVTALLPEGAELSEEEVGEILARAASGASAPVPARKLAPKPAPPSPLAASTARAGEADLHVHRLPSGATVVVRRETAVPLVALRAAFLGGLRYEEAETNGLTTLLSRTLHRGTAHHGAEEISHLVDDLAGSLHGAGGRSSVGLRGEFLSRHFERGFELFSEVLREPGFASAELDRERTHLLQEIHSRDDRPASVAFELFARTLYARHPYRLPLQGDAGVVERLTPEALRAYHRAHMDPSQLTLAVVGDVDVDRVMALAEARFGQAVAPEGPGPIPPPEPPLEGPREASKVLPRAQTHLVYGFLGARVTDPWRFALELLSTVLSGQGGRLFVELRDKRSMAYSVSSYSVESFDPGYFAVYMGTSPEKVDEALAAIRAELARVLEERIPEEELARAKQYLVGSHAIGLQRNGSRAGMLALDHCYGIGDENFRRYGERLSAVTADEVLEVARRVIDLDRGVLARVGPA